MDIEVSDKVIMKKEHPCKNSEFVITRVGMDIKIKCIKCGREIIMPRRNFMKNVKKFVDKDI